MILLSIKLGNGNGLIRGDQAPRLIGKRRSHVFNVAFDLGHEVVCWLLNTRT